jgi:hypothetical protein
LSPKGMQFSCPTAVDPWSLLKASHNTVDTQSLVQFACQRFVQTASTPFGPPDHSPWRTSRFLAWPRRSRSSRWPQRFPLPFAAPDVYVHTHHTHTPCTRETFRSIPLKTQSCESSIWVRVKRLLTKCSLCFPGLSSPSAEANIASAGGPHAFIVVTLRNISYPDSLDCATLLASMRACMCRARVHMQEGKGPSVAKASNVTVHATGIVKETGKKFWCVNF